MNDVYLMVFSGFMGYFLNKLGFSMSAVIIGIILGSMAEQNFVSFRTAFEPLHLWFGFLLRDQLSVSMLISALSGIQPADPDVTEPAPDKV